MGVKDSASAIYRVEPEPVHACEDAVPRGYKRTEAGVIPESWNARALAEIVNFTNGRPHERDIVEDGRYYLITLDSIGIDGALKSEHQRTEAFDDSLKLGDIVSVLSDIAHGNLLGLSDLIQKDGRYVLNQRMARLRLKIPAVAEFVRLQINRRQEHFRQRGQGTSQRHIYRRDFDELLIPFPDVEEQEAIAEALGDADALIESLQQLIAKQRAIEQGAMQALLTGRQRLPGFTGEWKRRKLAEFGFVYGGLTGKTKRDFEHGAGRYVTFMNVMANVVIDTNAYDAVAVGASEQQNRVARGDLFFNGSSETPEEVGMCSALTKDAHRVFLNSFCFGFRPNSGARIDPLYLAYFFRSAAGRHLLAPLAQGATRYNLSKTALLQLEFPLPAKEEQTAIAAMLSDMDAEIEALEARLAKTRALKAGMMQALLTGRIRLV